MDQDKTTVMGGYGSPRTGNGADETRVVPNPGYAAPIRRRRRPIPRAL